MSGDRSRGPLWKFAPRVALAPSVRPLLPPAGGEARSARDVTAEDLRTLREDGEWRPATIVQRFGPMRGDGEYLPRLLVACGLLQGPLKIRELTERLIGLANVALPRLERMIDDESLERRHDRLKAIRDRSFAARQDLPATRARANNDLDPTHPDGLRAIDLEMLASDTGAVILGSEIATKRNLTGIDYAIRTVADRPEQRYAEDWMARVFGTVSGILLFTPPEYGRVVVVHEDGRLAYDPAGTAGDPDGDA